MNYSAFVFFILLFLIPDTYSQQRNFIEIDPTDSEADIIRKAAHVVPSDRQFRWQQLELTAFFHFGINTFTNNEWGRGNEEPSLFNPSELDARQWIKVAKEAGIKQVILTAKHHDGFCLWPSRFTRHTVAESPWNEGRGDVVREVSEACREFQIGFGIYVSPWDRNHPSYGSDDYNDFFVNQLTELLSNYGKIDEVWFDGASGEGANGKKQVYDFQRYYQVIRHLQPEAVIAIMGPDVRWVGTESGYGRETEWSVVPGDQLDLTEISENSQKEVIFKPMDNLMDNDLGSRDKIRNARSLVWYPAETDVSIRPGWFFHTDQNDQVKTVDQLMDIYFNSVGKNGVLLLNIPPDQRGLIHENDVKNLKEWKNVIDQTFKVNLLKDAAVVSINGIHAGAITDDDYQSYWTTKGSDTTAKIEFEMKAPGTFDVIMLQENIRIGQRIESFSAEYWTGNEWNTFATGTTVGYKRLIRFDQITAQKIRIIIHSSRLNPTLSEVGLYKQGGSSHEMQLH